MVFLFFTVCLSSCGILSNGSDNAAETLFPGIGMFPDDPYALPDSPDPRLPNTTANMSEWVDDGILRLPMRVPLTLNPLLNRDQTVARILGMLFEPLAVLDENLRVTGHLAELNFALDFSGVEITIKNEAIWSDGLPVSSDDFIFSLDVLRRAPSDAIYRSTVENIESVQRVSDRTVQVTFVNANPSVGYSLLFPLIPRHYYRNETDPASLRNLSPLGNGSFIFEGMVPRQSVMLVRNPNTFRTLPAIERVEILLLPDTQIDLYAFDGRLIDAIYLPLPEWVRNPTAKEINAAEIPTMHFEFIGFNFTREIFNDLDVRQGIAYAFDANEAITTLYLRHAVKSATPIHPEGWMHDPTALGLPHDPDLARLLLREVPREEPLTIIVSENSPERIIIAHRLQAGLEEAGLDAEVHAINDAEFLTKLTANDGFDLFIGWMELDYVPNFTFMFDGERTGGVLFNHDPLLMDLSAAIRVAATESAFIEAISQFQHAFIEQVPLIGLAFRHSALLMGTRVQADIPPAPSHIFIRVNEWKINAN